MVKKKKEWERKGKIEIQPWALAPNNVEHEKSCRHDVQTVACHRFHVSHLPGPGPLYVPLAITEDMSTLSGTQGSAPISSWATMWGLKDISPKEKTGQVNG